MCRLCGVKTLLLVCLFLLAVPFYAFAEEFDGSVVEPYGAGEWDYKGQETVIFSYTKGTITDEYYATDGGNFKIDIKSYDLNSNSVSATIYINDSNGGTKGVAYSDGNGTIEFSNIPKGAKVWFYISVSNYDTINFKFYD